jgi:hypothetical protein
VAKLAEAAGILARMEGKLDLLRADTRDVLAALGAQFRDHLTEPA